MAVFQKKSITRLVSRQAIQLARFCLLYHWISTWFSPLKKALLKQVYMYTLISVPSYTIEKYCELLPLPITIEALEVIVISKISHHFPNIIINEERLKLFDSDICRAQLKIFQIPHSATVRTFFQPKVNGGLGVRKPSLVYRASRVCHLICMLNHEDENIQFVAKNRNEMYPDRMTKITVLVIKLR